jgi:hypothetical protein
MWSSWYNESALWQKTSVIICITLLHYQNSKRTAAIAMLSWKFRIFTSDLTTLAFWGQFYAFICFQYFQIYLYMALILLWPRLLLWYCKMSFLAQTYVPRDRKSVFMPECVNICSSQRVKNCIFYCCANK